MVEITTDGRTVWVNAPMCIGRLGPTYAEVFSSKLSGGANDVYAYLGAGDWWWWVNKMKEIHGLEIPESYRPVWFV